MSGILFIISGPAGVGKTTAVNALLKAIPSSQLQRSVTTTTRPMRPDEIDGVHYFFISEEKFENKIRAGDFLEYARVHGRTYYGSSKEEVYTKLSQGINIILIIDVQGYFSVLKNCKNFRIVSIFIRPQTPEVLYDRLINRGTESDVEIKNRLHTAENELLFADQYQYVVTSGTREHDFAEILKIYNKETKVII